MKYIDRFIWLDLETTGLRPDMDVILELGVIITDGRLNELDARSWVIARCMPEERQNARPEVQELHDKSGLWADCARSGLLHNEVEAFAMQFIRAFGPSEVVPIAGTGPHFDKRFLDLQMPTLATVFNYRTFDGRTLMQAWCQATGCSCPDRPDGEAAHRALPDLRWIIGHSRAVVKAIARGLQ